MGFVLAGSLLILGGFVIAGAHGAEKDRLLELSAGSLILLMGAVHLVSACVMYRHRLGCTTQPANRHHTPTTP